MRNRVLGSMIVLVSVLAFSSLAYAQGGGRAATATSTAPFDPHDLSGVWSGLAVADNLTKDEPPMTPAALAYYKQQKTEYSNPPVDGPGNTDPLFHCEPGSVPRDYFVNHPMEFVQTPKETIQLLEVYRNFRIIYTDGRKQADHPEGTWYGDSVGHWEGNTFVVETVNFNDRTWIDKVGHPHSDKMKLTERFTRVDHDHLKDEITIDDPVYYTKPWGGTKVWAYKPTWQIEDYLCSASDEAEMSKVVRDPAGEGTGKK